MLLAGDEARQHPQTLPRCPRFCQTGQPQNVPAQREAGCGRSDTHARLETVAVSSPCEQRRGTFSTGATGDDDDGGGNDGNDGNTEGRTRRGNTKGAGSRYHHRNSIDEDNSGTQNTDRAASSRGRSRSAVDRRSHPRQATLTAWRRFLPKGLRPTMAAVP